MTSSLWSATTDQAPYPRLSGDVSVDVVIVGGGIFGLTAGLLLKEAGKSVALLEARAIGSGTTGSSTGKLTSQHGAKYHDLIKSAGKEIAQAYAQANQWAIEEVARLVSAHGVECDFERRAACLLALSSKGAERLKREAEAASQLHLPVAGSDTVKLAQPAAGSLVFTNQAQFHPHRYLRGLAAALDGDGCHVFENTRVRDVSGRKPQRVEADSGTVGAQDVIVATNLPFLDRGGFFARAYPRAHVGIAASLPAEQAPEAMFLCIDGTPHSYRSWREADRAYVIAIGEGFIPGHVDDVRGIAEKLAEEVRRLWPIEEVTHRWMAEDYHAADGVPYVGKLPFGSSRIYTATGFGAWGLTNGTAAGRLVADLVLEREPTWPALNSPLRAGSALSARFLRRNAHVAQHWVEGRLSSGDRRSLSSLAQGEGAILKTEEGKLAVYRDEAGSFHSFSPYCPHMQCLLSWNNLEKTWDCACHGSRFAAEGDLLHGPATSDLRAKPLP